MGGRNMRYCRRCGLEYRNWASKIESPACEECEPEKYYKIYKTNVAQIKKKNVGQEHITEHTFFPKEKKIKVCSCGIPEKRKDFSFCLKCGKINREHAL